MAETENPNPTAAASPRRQSQRALAGVGLMTLVLAALFGGNAFGVRDSVLGTATPDPRPAAVGRAAEQSTVTTGGPVTTLARPEGEHTVLRSQPWWQSLGTREGRGNATTASFTVDPGAVQWRVRWSCDTGDLLVRVPGRSRPVVREQCPGTGIGYGTQTGSVALDVEADGPWKLQVEQQIDVPLHEPPPPAMTAPGASAVAAGEFYRVDQVGQGRVTVYRLPDATYALRLDDFYVSPNVDLEIRLSPLEDPRTTGQIAEAPSVSVAKLDVTAGSLNFSVPREIDPTKYRSVIIWCEPTYNAYAAARLTPPSR